MKLSDLDPAHRILVLGWMRDGIEHGIANSVKTKAYRVFILGCRPNGMDVKTEFDPEQFWAERLQPHERGHFQRVATALDNIDALIDDAEAELDELDDDDEQDQIAEIDRPGIPGATGHPGPSGAGDRDDYDLDGPVPGFDGGSEQ